MQQVYLKKTTISAQIIEIAKEIGMPQAFKALQGELGKEYGTIEEKRKVFKDGSSLLFNPLLKEIHV